MPQRTPRTPAKGRLQCPSLPTLCVALTLAAAAAFTAMHTDCAARNMQTLDTLAMISYNLHGTAYADCLFNNLSSKLIWAPAVIALVFTMARGSRNWRQAALLILVSVAIVVACDQLSGLVKRTVERPRPSHNDALNYMLHYVNDYRGGRFGFVSSHAANCCGMAAWLMLVYRSRAVKAVLLVFATAVCYSRIYLGVHYPLDIVAGAMLGVLTGTAAWTLLACTTGKYHCLIADRRGIVAWTAAGTMAAIAALSAFGIFL